MRILLSKNSKRKLYKYLKEITNSKNIRDLSKKIKIPKNTFDTWIYNENTYIPEEKIPNRLISELEILDKKPNNWGK